MIAQILGAYLLSKGYNVGPTLQNVCPQGRLDVVASSALEAVLASNPIASTAFTLLRPQIDGFLVSRVGPIALVSQLAKYMPEEQAYAVLEGLSTVAGRLAPKGAKSQSKARGRKAKRQGGESRLGLQRSEAPKGATVAKASKVKARVKVESATAEPGEVIDLEFQDGVYA
jgi:hypothetical protein